jgi:PPM family protein phosphatase
MRLIQGFCSLVGTMATYAGATDIGRIRQCNEDELAIIPELGLFAVADGLGGLDAGDIASHTALSFLRDLCLARDENTNEDMAVWLSRTIATINRRTYEHRMELKKNMATTLALVQLGRQTALAAHVGDSRIYRWHANTLTRITSDHSLVNALCEQGALTASQARQSPQRHVITRAIGAEPSVDPSITPISVAAGDMLLLCTDGLTNMVTDEQIAACLADQCKISRIVEQLVQMANEAGGHDNITAIAVAIGQ